MFDGKTLKGWKVNSENPQTFSVEDGAIKVEALVLTSFMGQTAMPSSKTLNLSVKLKLPKMLMRESSFTLNFKTGAGPHRVMNAKSMPPKRTGVRRVVFIAFRMSKNPGTRTTNGLHTTSKSKEKK